MLKTNTIAAICGLITALIVTSALLPLLKRMKARQEILSYVKLHAGKKGTPTMGGIAFLTAFSAVGLIFCGKEKIAVITVAVTLAYGAIGFLDDFIKIRYRRNLGLTAWQKTLAQIAVAVISATYVYHAKVVGSLIKLPFSGREIDIGFLIIPLGVLVFLSSSNGANLLDGLDGLASSVTACMTLCACVLLCVESNLLDGYGLTFMAEETKSLACLSAVMTGCLTAFLVFNCNPASLFMGDTGSMAIGAFCACVTLFSGNVLTLVFLGMAYVVTVLSVIFQVFYFKLTKGKRLLLMAPLHHHLQMKGLSETRIAVIYSVVTLIIGGIILALRCGKA